MQLLFRVLPSQLQSSTIPRLALPQDGGVPCMCCLCRRLQRLLCSNPHRGKNEERLVLTDTLMLFFALGIRPCRMDGKQPVLYISVFSKGLFCSAKVTISI